MYSVHSCSVLSNMGEGFGPSKTAYMRPFEVVPLDGTTRHVAYVTIRCAEITFTRSPFLCHNYAIRHTSTQKLFSWNNKQQEEEIKE